MPRVLCVVTGLFVLTLWSTAAGAASAGEETLTPRERVLLEKMETLEKRVVELEKRLEVKEADTGETKALTERVEKVETLVKEDLTPAPADFHVFWKSGVRFETQDERFKFRIGGRMHNDWAFIGQDRELAGALGDEEDGTEFRSLRLALSGTMYDRFEFKTEYDFATGVNEFKDVYVGMNSVPCLGNIKFGHVYEPFSMNELESSNTMPFMERGLPVLALSIGRNVGVTANNTALNQRMTWAAGFFREADDFGKGQQDGDYSMTGRITGLPWYKEEGKKLVHLGAAYSYRNVDGQRRYSARPEAHLTQRYLDTGTVTIDEMNVYGLELGLKLNAFTMQAEYLLNDADTLFFGNADFDGYYVSASYFLTGEDRVYNLEEGYFGGITPKANFGFGENAGLGAWEVALRYSRLDLDEGWITGGRMNDWTLGLNWYWNPNMRVMLNYIRSDVDHVLYDGGLNILQGRFNVSF